MDLKEEYPALPSLRMMLCGSSYMPVEKLKQLHKWLPTTEIRTVFGMTETASLGNSVSNRYGFKYLSIFFRKTCSRTGT